MRRVTNKWRPTIGLVVLSILLTVMVLPLAALFSFHLYQNHFTDRTEAGLAVRGAMVAATIVLAATLGIAFVFVRAITRPIHELMQRTARIAAGGSDAIRPLDHHGTREMAELSNAFLDMARKLQSRSETIRTFATHVSHELKSPLTSIQGAAELLRDAGTDMDIATRTRFQNNIIADADRLNRLVRRLIELARAESARPSDETASLAEILDRIAPIEGLVVKIDSGADVRFKISSENGAIILSNLAENSARHDATCLLLTVRREYGLVTIVALDDGSGIAPPDRQRVFEPFFTTRREAGGTGLGLGIVSALLKEHGGTIRLADSERGARFEISLAAG